MDARKVLDGIREGDWMSVIDGLDVDHRFTIMEINEPVDALSVAVIGKTLILGQRHGDQWRGEVMVHGDESCAEEAWHDMLKRNRMIRLAMLTSGLPMEGVVFTVDGEPDPVHPGMVDAVLRAGDRLRGQLGMVVPDDIRELLNGQH